VLNVRMSLTLRPRHVESEDCYQSIQNSLSSKNVKSKNKIYSLRFYVLTTLKR
jgi:hypothetical protein